MVTRKEFGIGGLAGIFLFLTFFAFAQAQTPFDFTLCVTGPTTMLSSSQELRNISHLVGEGLKDFQRKVA